MALSALDTDRIRSGFQIERTPVITRVERVSRMETKLQAATAADASEARGITTVICPLCGTHKPFSPDVFRRTKFEKLVNVGSTKDTTGLNILAEGEGIDLLALSHRKDLSGLKRQVIRRCLEIVRKLSK